MLTGPPPKFHGTRDILPVGPPVDRSRTQRQRIRAPRGRPNPRSWKLSRPRRRQSTPAASPQSATQGQRSGWEQPSLWGSDQRRWLMHLSRRARHPGLRRRPLATPAEAAPPRSLFSSWSNCDTPSDNPLPNGKMVGAMIHERCGCSGASAISRPRSSTQASHSRARFRSHRFRFRRRLRWCSRRTSRADGPLRS